jgi:uncharacterized membrane protein YkvA (DUF1232 family)
MNSLRFFTTIADWITTPYTVYLVLKDPAIPRMVKIRAVILLVLIFAYVVSPVDIIPDFIPLSGWIDDLVVIPLGLTIVRKTTPGIDIVEKRARAERSVKRILLWTLLGIVLFFLLGLVWFGLLIYAIVRLIIH